MSEPRLCLAARVIVLDDSTRTLLVRFDFGDRVVWATPGGGIEDGASDEHALRQQLVEEAGLEGFELGPLVWTRTHLVPFGGGRWDGQAESYYLVRTAPFEPAPHLTWEELRAEGMTATRWWTLDELEAADAIFATRRPSTSASRGLMWVSGTSGWGPARFASRPPRSAPRRPALPPIASTALLGAGPPRTHP